MADKDRFLEEEEAPAQGGEEAEAGKRVGIFPSLLLKILKWVAIVVAILILVIVVVVIMVRALVGDTTALAQVTPVSQDYEAVPPNLQYFQNVGQIRGQSSDTPAASFIAEVHLGYEQGNNALTAEINEKATIIHNRVLIFLSKKTASQLHPAKAEELQQDLKREINRLLRTGKIQLVVFKELQSFGGS